MNQPQAAPKRDHARSQSSKNLLNQGQKGSRRPSGQATHALSRCQWQPTFAHLDEPQATGAHTKSKHTRCITNGGLGLGQGCRNRTKKTPVGHNTTIRTSRKAACVQAEADADKLAATFTTPKIHADKSTPNQIIVSHAGAVILQVTDAKGENVHPTKWSIHKQTARRLRYHQSEHVDSVDHLAVPSLEEQAEHFLLLWTEWTVAAENRAKRQAREASRAARKAQRKAAISKIRKALVAYKNLLHPAAFTKVSNKSQESISFAPGFPYTSKGATPPVHTHPSGFMSRIKSALVKPFCASRS